MPSDLSPVVNHFLTKYIVSVEELEVLLLLHGAKERAWTAAEINQQLRSNETSIERWLSIIVSFGLAARTEDRVRFAPASDELAQGVAQVAAMYRERPAKVIAAIFSKRNEDLLDFVRAFDLRKKP